MSFLSDYLGPLFLLSVGISAVIGAWSAHVKAKRVFALEGVESPQKQRESAVAKALIAAGFAGIVWSDSSDLDEAVVRVAIPFGAYKFVQLLLMPILGSQMNPPMAKLEDSKVDNG